MKNLLLLFAVCILLQSCNSVNIESLETKVVQYVDLPKEVKNVLFESDYIELNGVISLNLFTDLNEISKYEYLSKQHWLMSWVYNSELYRKTDKKTIKLDFKSEYGSKYIIHLNYLYVPRHYNIYKADSLNYSFSSFKLE